MWLAAACGIAPSTPPLPATASAPARPTATAAVSVLLAVGEASPTPRADPANAGLRATLADYAEATGDDPTGDKTLAFATLRDFTNPNGPYGSAWWFADDGLADVTEVLAVILYTEGHTSFDVRTAVAARYLWYCGGTGTTCSGHALINYLSYFQPWRQPWAARGFTNEHAAEYRPFAREVTLQLPGLLATLIPGANDYRADPDGLSLAGPVEWSQVPFHFANVDPSWDAYLREQLRRLPNGPARLWVLTMAEASKVCGSPFVCADMTRPR